MLRGGPGLALVLLGVNSFALAPRLRRTPSSRVSWVFSLWCHQWYRILPSSPGAVFLTYPRRCLESPMTPLLLLPALQLLVETGELTGVFFPTL